MWDRYKFCILQDHGLVFYYIRSYFHHILELASHLLKSWEFSRKSPSTSILLNKIPSPAGEKREGYKQLEGTSLLHVWEWLLFTVSKGWFLVWHLSPNLCRISISLNIFNLSVVSISFYWEKNVLPAKMKGWGEDRCTERYHHHLPVSREQTNPTGTAVAW